MCVWGVFMYVSQCKLQKGSNTKRSIAVGSYFRKVETTDTPPSALSAQVEGT